ncbi:MAG: sigma-54-dependent Fis family transcriptional regulator [Aquificae bacterium]|nr:sigma-54-dependent Fis family transcriptional regulator [Aquificota bacterium]
MEEKGKMLLVDDEEDVLQSFKMMFEMEGYQVLTAPDPIQALSILKETEVDLVISDMKMGDIDGYQFLKMLREFDDITSFIVLTAYGTVDNAVKCIKDGAFYYFEKPAKFEEPSFWKIIDEAINKTRLLRENRKLKEKLEKREKIDFIITQNQDMKAILQWVEEVAKYNVDILIQGESGVGKELIAKAIQTLSPRKDKPFIPLNCASFQKDLLEAELFGYRRGAFTGATEDKKGIFEEADGGTIFLDEIGELPLDIQAKLLRTLQDGEIKRIGDNKPIKVDVRIIAATNKDLEKLVEKGLFREDLYYRISKEVIKIPPLRERKEDIPPLVMHFIQKYNKRFNKNILGIKPDALKVLLEYNWPGNVRELSNVIEGAVLRAKDGGYIEKEHLRKDVFINVDKFPLKYEEYKEEIIKKGMKTYLNVLLSMTSGNITQAARLAGIPRQSLQRLMKKYGVKVK